MLVTTVGGRGGGGGLKQALWTWILGVPCPSPRRGTFVSCIPSQWQDFSTSPYSLGCPSSLEKGFCSLGKKGRLNSNSRCYSSPPSSLPAPRVLSPDSLWSSLRVSGVGPGGITCKRRNLTFVCSLLRLHFLMPTHTWSLQISSWII